MKLLLASLQTCKASLNPGIELDMGESLVFLFDLPARVLGFKSAGGRGFKPLPNPVAICI